MEDMSDEQSEIKQNKKTPIKYTPTGGQSLLIIILCTVAGTYLPEHNFTTYFFYFCFYFLANIIKKKSHNVEFFYFGFILIWPQRLFQFIKNHNNAFINI